MCVCICCDAKNTTFQKSISEKTQSALIMRPWFVMVFPALPKADWFNLFPELNSSLPPFHVKYQTFQYHYREGRVAQPV